ncbi:MAG: tetratricopeptide repeat protein [Pseudomonadales bacterium]|nr:tetratricopeptide repeat protein [Pseudomonadales bacterium]
MQKEMLRQIVVLIIIIVLFPLVAVAEVERASDLVNGDLSELEGELREHENRVEALQKLTNKQPEAVETDKPVAVTSPVTQTETDVAVTSTPERATQSREDEESFVKMLPVSGVEFGQTKVEQLASLVAEITAGAKSIHALEMMVRDNPEYRDARISLARLHILNAAPAKALVTLKPLTTPLLEADHPDWQVWFWQGTARLAMGELARARKDLEASLGKGREQVATWIQLAVVEQELGNHAAAIQYLDIAQQVDPSEGQIYLNRAYSLEHLGDYDEAAKAYRGFLVADVQAPSRQARVEVVRRISDLAAITEVPATEEF